MASLNGARLRACLGMALLVASAAAPVHAQTSCVEPTGPAVPPAVTGGDAALAAAQPGPAPSDAPLQCWVGASGNAVLGSRAIALGELIVTVSDRNEVVAFPPDGSETWRVQLGEPGEGLPGGLTTDGRLVFAAAPVGLVALDPGDGSEAWRVPVEGGAVTGDIGAQSPVVAGDRVYAVLNTHAERGPLERAMVALDAASGAERWRILLDATLPAGPISTDGSLVAVWDGRGSVFAFEADTGMQRWEVTVEDLGLPPAAPISIAGGRLVTALAGGEVVALSADDGSRLWSAVPESGLAAAVTAQGDTVYVNAVTALQALDAADGSTRWTAPVQQQVPPFDYRPVPAVADGLVILGTTDVDANAALLAFEAATGAERWRTTIDIFGALLSPIVSGGRVYAPGFDINQHGGLFAFGAAG